MQEDVKQRIRVARHAVVDLFLPGGNGRMYWPNRLQPQHEATPSIRRKSLRYILDSGFNDKSDITTQDLLDAVSKYQPDYVIPNDCVRYQDGVDEEKARTETAAQVGSFLDAVDERSLAANVLVPLQPPYDEHLALLEAEYPRQAKRSHFALGGLARAAPADQLAHVRRFRAIAGKHAYAHGFGMGVSRQLIEALRADPWLLDSVDASTAQQHAKNGQLAGTARVSVYVGPAAGNQVSTTAGQYIMAEMVDLARMLAPSLTDPEDLAIDDDTFPNAADNATLPATSGSSDDASDSGESHAQLGVDDFVSSNS